MKRGLLVVPLVLLFAACGGSSDAPAAAPPAAPAKPPEPPKPAAPIATGKLAAAVAARQGKALRVSVGVYDAALGDALYEANPTSMRRPASVMKVATTAAALLALGPGAELATEVFATAKPDEAGLVAGDLVVKGAGDPGINNRDGLGMGSTPGKAEATLRTMAKAVRAAGVRRVTGELVVDDQAFIGPTRHAGWDWGDGDWAWFKAPVASVLLTDACAELAVMPGPAEGSAAVLSTDPPTQSVRFLDKVTTASASSKKTNVVLGRSDGAGTIPVTGDVPARSAGYHFDAACVDPPAHFGDVFLRLLREEGVEVAGASRVLRAPSIASVVARDPAPLVRLTRHATSVLDVVRVANKHSQNLYAELLLRATARAAGEEASFEGGCRAVRKTLGLDAADRSFAQVDGSGLARENQMTVGAMGRILVRMYGAPCARDFISSLPGAAEPDSTLRKRFAGAKYDNRIYAKTGTLRDTSSLAGYVQTKSGRTLAFVVLCEGDVGRARELQDDVVEALVEQ